MTVPTSIYNEQKLSELADGYMSHLIQGLMNEARHHLLSYTQLTFPTYKADDFHRHLAEVFTKITSGEISDKRIIINAPPQHGKSELASVRFPSYWLSKRPNDPVMLASYTAKLALSKSKNVRDTLSSRVSNKLFPNIKVRQDSRAKDYWELKDYKGFFIAGGVGGSLTGFGAKLIIIDDPLKSWAEAQSEATREKLKEWYHGTLLTRLAEDGVIVLIATRWHEDDLPGYLLRVEPQNWTLLKYRALCTNSAEDPLGRPVGEALSPSRYSKEYLATLRDGSPPLIWNAEYQQDPYTPEGDVFDTSKINFVDPEDVDFKSFDIIVRYWDFAATEQTGKNDPDATCGALVGVRGLGLQQECWILNLIHGRWAEDRLERKFVATARMDGRFIPIWIEREGGSSGKQIIHYYRKLVPGHQVYEDLVTHAGSKLVRAQPLAGRIHAGKFYMVRGPWNDIAVAELAGFPNYSHDDTVDGMSGGYNKASVRTKKKAKMR